MTELGVLYRDEVSPGRQLRVGRDVNRVAHDMGWNPPGYQGVLDLFGGVPPRPNFDRAFDGIFVRFAIVQIP